MPIPVKNPGENKEKFIQRCMSDKTMVREYPDNRQRYAICISKSKK